MSVIRINGKGNPEIIKDTAFCVFLENQLPNEEKSLKDLFDEFDDRLVQENKKIKAGALSNAHGDWYEWLLAISAWNYYCKNPDSNLAILLPNVTQFDVTTLYEKRLNNLIFDLKQKIFEASKVNLTTSNPDFVIINNVLAREILDNPAEIKNITTESLKTLKSIYHKFIEKCSFEQIEGYIAVKTSLRPDRRLQIPHEGSLMKALYAHLQTREWIVTPKGLKYYAIATKISKADKDAFKTVATHSLTTVFSSPEPAVDNVYVVNSLEQASSTFSAILS